MMAIDTNILIYYLNQQLPESVKAVVDKSKYGVLQNADFFSTDL
jgi:predicted nucleic acid-binding protein